MALLGNLSRLPGSPQLHRWADWAELLCLHSPDGELSVGDLAEAAESRLAWLDSEGNDEAEPDAEGESVAGGSDAETNDKFVSRARQVFEYLYVRQSRFGEWYPFELGNDQRMLTLRDATWLQDVYLFLTVCSSLRYVPSGSDRTSLTSRYEAICLEGTKRQLGSRAEVHLFGKNAELTTGRYVGRLKSKIELLAQDLNERVRFGADDFGPRDFGDNGLDIVAWIPSGDEVGGKLVAFGQCACTPEWVTKQHSSGDDAWYEVMSLQARPLNICFIPYDFRRVDGLWYKRSSIRRSALIDRSRLLHNIALDGLEVEDEKRIGDILRLDQINEERGAGVSEL